MSTKAQIESFISFLNAYNELISYDKENIDNYLYHIECYECNNKGYVKLKMYNDEILKYLHKIEYPWYEYIYFMVVKSCYAPHF